MSRLNVYSRSCLSMYKENYEHRRIEFYGIPTYSIVTSVIHFFHEFFCLDLRRSIICEILVFGL